MCRLSQINYHGSFIYTYCYMYIYFKLLFENTENANNKGKGLKNPVEHEIKPHQKKQQAKCKVERYYIHNFFK